MPPVEIKLHRGTPWPLGANFDGNGVNFALFSANAERVELCLFDEDGDSFQTYPLPCCTDQVWHGYLPNAAPGLRYAYRVDGAAAPGHKFTDRLLLDPYARELAGDFSYQSSTKSAHGLGCKVVADGFDWQGDALLNTPNADSILYEIHVKGATQSHPQIPNALRGTYAGLASPPMLAHFKKLGITAVNLLPVHAFVDEERLLKNGLTNYWGYNTLSFFAPEARYAAHVNGQSTLDEFRTMVRTLHQAGIEVILDVVFNHTAETDEYGPTLSFRGIDNAVYYRLPKDAPDLYENFSGCGNTFNLAHPRVLQLVMDSLRYWVGEMHIDGFRFDLAAALTRESAFLAAIAQDPLLSRVKLIAEPWDLGPYGYQLGRFSPGWGEWNDHFRDDVRAFWLTGGVGVGALAQRLAGSSEIFDPKSRSPQAGINFITAHDGFTLRDLVSYQHKHNEQNGENNLDGHGNNISWNCGEEGATQNLVVLDRRQRLQRALLATLFLAQGIPMLQGGDELGRTQLGNNNAYCQDNLTTWINWDTPDNALIEFTAGLIALRQRFSQLRRRTWLTGKVGQTGRDISWLRPDGGEMTQYDWSIVDGLFGFLLAPEETSADGASEKLLVLINRQAENHRFNLPAGSWQRLCDTGAAHPFAASTIDPVGEAIKRSELTAYSLQIFTQESSS